MTTKLLHLMIGLGLPIMGHTATPSTTNAVSLAVGQVGSQVITSREVQISYAIDQATLLGEVEKPAVGKAQAKNKSAPDKKLWFTKPGEEVFKAHLNQMMIELLVKLEAETFSVAQVSTEEVRRETELAKTRLQDAADWKRWEVSDTEIEQIVARRKMAKQFLKFKTESSGVVVSDDEAKAYFEKNKVKFGSSNFPQFKEAIKEMLAQKQLEEKLKDWFEILKRKYRVRFLKDPGQAEPTKTL